MSRPRLGALRGAALAAVWLASSGLLRAAAPTPEVKALWVVRTALVSPAAVDKVVDDAARAGFTTLLVQVRGRGDAFYRSKLVSRSSLLSNQPATFDPLGRLLERARAHGLEVHGWVNVLLTAHFGQPLPLGHVLREHPEWVMVPKAMAAAALRARPTDLQGLVLKAARTDADVEGYYISPAAPGVVAHLEAVVRELVRGYPLDGLHLDFVRYPGPDYDYSRVALEGFRRSQGGGDLLAGPAHRPEAWEAYRRAQVTGLVQRLSAAARAERPHIQLTAAVAPDEAQAVAHKGQDWPTWLTTGLVDTICPMAYTPDTDLFRTLVDKVVARGGARRVWVGIGAYRLTLDGTVERIRLARATGAAGIAVFSHESFAADDLDRLRDRAFGGVSVKAAPAAPAASAR